MKCGKALATEKIVWLALDTRTNTYTDEELPPKYDQGCFEFGPDCAKKEIEEHQVWKRKRLKDGRQR